MHLYREKYSICWVQYYLQLQASIGGSVSEHILQIRGTTVLLPCGFAATNVMAEQRVGERWTQLVSLSKYKPAPARHLSRGSFLSVPKIGRGYSLFCFLETTSFCLHGLQILLHWLKIRFFFFLILFEVSLPRKSTYYPPLVPLSSLMQWPA